MINKIENNIQNQIIINEIFKKVKKFNKNIIKKEEYETAHKMKPFLDKLIDLNYEFECLLIEYYESMERKDKEEFEKNSISLDEVSREFISVFNNFKNNFKEFKNK